MFQEIGAFDAKAKLSELLRGVGHGQRYTITVRGKPVADLVPSETSAHTEAQAAVAAMQAFKKITGVSNEDVSEMISEGRR
ncbi:type II toxin-antitoxin system Phd/YefM family antitoxin [Collimonas pratensis]|uniref:Antitoxin n=1 Tax=Collimonas pratensis TaxID=279113 RepID=A0A127PXR9_9BURK|nr:type II toxin-antitoxin system prevent-host-death family antitoxin [Collimonas pratensis]AMP02587.1 prevent-host-death family protein [Collimonas pratensis]